jgi:hypothetical protein
VTDGADTESYPMADFIVSESSFWFSYVVQRGYVCEGTT